MLKKELSQKIKLRAASLGFFRAGITKAEPLDGAHLDVWLSRSFHGDMAYMKDRRDMRLDPAKLVTGAKSIIVCAMNYYTPFESATAADEGCISRYAWGDDYHDVIRARLKKLLAAIQELAPGTNGRAFVDSAPVMEKEWAVRAGIGRQGKHSNVITRDYGSWFFLGEVIVDIELDYDAPYTADYCGSCTKCIDACPTGAIVAPRVVDARTCISYLTIELKTDRPVPEALQSKMGNHIFGCDICQDVCPWNKRFAQATDEPAFQPRPHNRRPKLSELERMEINEFREKYRKSPIKRAKLEGVKRSVEIAKKNRDFKGGRQ